MAPFQKDPRFFTKDWTITIPSHPDSTLKFIRLTPALKTEFIQFANEAGEPPGPQTLEASSPVPPPFTGERMIRQYTESLTLHHALDVYISLSDKFVGWGSIHPIPPPDQKPSIANIGIKLAPEVRGKGLGKILMQLLLRLSNEVDVDVIEAGTMKENTGMRALARSVGLVETDEVKVIEGKGIVAELLFKDIERERWRGLEMVVDFWERGE
jgi:RimJ/RimL family protein N-acetyltransferase